MNKNVENKQNFIISMLPSSCLTKKNIQKPIKMMLISIKFEKYFNIMKISAV